MKKSLIFTVAISSLFITSCSEEFLDPVRNTATITSEDITNLAQNNPALVAGTLEGISSFMVQPGGSAGISRHYDLGQKGIDIWLDIISGDMALSANSYGWYQNVANLVTTVDLTREENRIAWNYYYKVINTANTVINNLGGNDAVIANTASKHIMGQAKASRAYAYFYLTQLFQREYDPAMPILPYYDGQVSNPAKVPASDIYALIISDLTEAIDLLSDFSRNGKNQIDKNVAKGLLAYTYAAIGDNASYTQAKLLSEEIISSGVYPLTTSGQLAFPGSGSGFNNVNTPSWMWGYDITPDMGHQLVNWWGQMDYFTYSYAWAGDRKSIDTGLLSAIPANDVRRTQFGTTGVTTRMPINKFFDPGRTAGGQQAITTDYIFMRIEEFYLLSAEASAVIGAENDAKQRLKDLLTIRLGSLSNAQAAVDPLSGQALKNFIYLQTRIEFWGEGKSYLAMKRNKATVTRGTNHVFRSGESFLHNIDEMSFQIPQTELNNNPSITTQN